MLSWMLCCGNDFLVSNNKMLAVVKSSQSILKEELIPPFIADSLEGFTQGSLPWIFLAVGICYPSQG